MFAGKASYALGPDVPVVCVCDDAQHFAFRYDQHQWAGRDMVVIAAAGESTGCGMSLRAISTVSSRCRRS